MTEIVLRIEYNDIFKIGYQPTFGHISYSGWEN